MINGHPKITAAQNKVDPLWPAKSENSGDCTVREVQKDLNKRNNVTIYVNDVEVHYLVRKDTIKYTDAFKNKFFWNKANLEKRTWIGRKRRCTSTKKKELWARNEGSYSNHDKHISVQSFELILFSSPGPARPCYPAGTCQEVKMVLETHDMIAMGRFLNYDVH